MDAFAQAAKPPARSAPPWLQFTAWGLAFSVTAAALLFPALWNGFPLIFADTGGYLARPFEHSLLIGRSALYGAFLAAGIGGDFWPNVLLQSGATAWLILLTLRVHGFSRRPGLAAALTTALAAATGLPWAVSMLMPDIFAPLAVLALHLLAFRRAALSSGERLGAAALVAIAVATHMGTLALGAGLILGYGVLRLVAKGGLFPRPLLAAPSLALAAGIALALASNAVIAGRLAFTPGGFNFAFARLVQDGIVTRYLQERCPDTKLRLCAYRDALPATADDWLWGWGSPLYKLGGPEAFAAEAKSVVLATLARYPGQHLATALRAVLRQLVQVRTGEGVNPHDTAHAVQVLERYAPEAMPRFAAARQQQNLFDFTGFNLLHVPVALIGLTALPVILVAAWRRRVAPQAAALTLTALLALLANAAIFGALSNPNDRYQSRIAWLAPLALGVAAMSRQALRARRPRRFLLAALARKDYPQS